MKTSDLNKNSRLTIETYNHNLIIDCLKNGFLIYNDNTGDSVQVSHKFCDFVFNLRNKPTIKSYMRLLAKFFTYDFNFDEKIFQTEDLESEYQKFIYSTVTLSDVLEIKNHSQLCLFLESLEYGIESNF